jgi:hypothetical protein
VRRFIVAFTVGQSSNPFAHQQKIVILSTRILRAKDLNFNVTQLTPRHKPR